MKRFLPFVLSLFTLVLTAQDLKSPSDFLGYELGTRFSRHHQVVDYFEYLGEQASDRVRLVEYGRTNEGRRLLLAYVSTASNLSDLEAIREAHLKSTESEGNSDKAIVWLSYNVHGNESVGTEASMQTIYELLTEKAAYLEHTVVIFDPCLNPDGRDRYINWYNQKRNMPYQVDPNSIEHHEGWLSGRSNHYMFDLNRDWAWLTQIESQQRIKYYNSWLPHVHVDFHEQGVNNPYYFAPAAEPYHEVITDFQRDFQVTIGKNHARYFDAKGWFYFTKEFFDLFYPSYGDTYPMYNGSIGMTYEQGGSGRAGLGILTQIGDTLTLKDRIAHHHTTGLSTVEVASQNVATLNSEFKKFYSDRSFKYKSYVLKGNADKIRMLEGLLAKHEIEFYRAANGTAKGFNYATGSNGTMRTDANDLVISTDQKKGTLVKVLFEPNAKLQDSLTYDITAWSLPYAYGLEAIASTAKLPTVASNGSQGSFGVQPAFAHVGDWNSMDDARFLAALLKEGIRVRTAHAPFSLEGKQYQRGSLIIAKSDNMGAKSYLTSLNRIAKEHQKELHAVTTGFVDSGKDFGSPFVQMIDKPKVAILSGGPTSTLRFGEVWHFFEQQLGYPVTVIDAEYFDRVDLSAYDALILPGGRYGGFFDADALGELKEWVSNGGNLIAMGGAIRGIDGDDGFGIQTKSSEAQSEDKTPMAFSKTRRERMKNAITGAIFKTKVDNSHPLAYGYGNSYFTLKLGSDSYAYLSQGNVAYLEEGTTPVSGFAGSNAQKKIAKTVVYAVESRGGGQVVYMVDNPLFRGFWENGKLFFANALFMLN
ncbi:MAG: zinc carboxypeptidase [Flavobacteriaceae bacterium]|nr:zinc carboxypeptidase [Flavobacteriaceae bacterium]